MEKCDLLTIDETERGNVLLTHSEEFYLNAWIQVCADVRAEISYRADNYPSFTFRMVEITDEDLATHIRKNFGGGCWIARKCNLPGITVADGGVIRGDDDAAS